MYSALILNLSWPLNFFPFLRILLSKKTPISADVLPSCVFFPMLGIHLTSVLLLIFLTLLTRAIWASGRRCCLRPMVIEARRLKENWPGVCFGHILANKFVLDLPEPNIIWIRSWTKVKQSRYIKRLYLLIIYEFKHL